MLSRTSYKSSQVTTLRQLLISGALLQLLAESAIATVLYKCWDNRCIFISLFYILQIFQSDASIPEVCQSDTSWSMLTFLQIFPSNHFQAAADQ
jgi:hypothetical protein